MEFSSICDVKYCSFIGLIDLCDLREAKSNKNVTVLLLDFNSQTENGVLYLF